MLNYVEQLTSLFTKSVALPARNVQFHLCHWKRISKWSGSVGWNTIVICRIPGNSHFDCFDSVKSQSIRWKLYLHNKCFTLEVTCHIPIYHINGSALIERIKIEVVWTKKIFINTGFCAPPPLPLSAWLRRSWGFLMVPTVDLHTLQALPSCAKVQISWGSWGFSRWLACSIFEEYNFKSTRSWFTMCRVVLSVFRNNVPLGAPKTVVQESDLGGL